jgi:hypothetical protein
VSSPDELRSYAVDCARLATATTNSTDKARLLNMARAWTALADRIEKIGQNKRIGAAAPILGTPEQGTASGEP